MPVRMPSVGVSALRRASLLRQFRASTRSAPPPSFASFSGADAAHFSGCASRSFATRSASAVASVENNAFRGDAKRQPTASGTTTMSTPSDASNNMMYMLEQSIADRQPSEALAYYNCLQSPPNGLTSQKLAILLAKQDSLHQTRRAFEILQAVYGSPEFEVDDYTQLASIYIVDACLRQKLLPEALEIFDHAHKSDISLDLPAYDGLVRALVADDQIARARELLVEIMAKKQVVLEQQTFQPLLLRLMERAEYDAVVDVIDHGRKHGVLFTFETYDPLVEMGELVDDSEDEDLWDELERFMSYINEALEEDGLTGLSDEDDDDEDDVTVEVAYDDDDDDDDDDGFGEDFDDHNQPTANVAVAVAEDASVEQQLLAQSLADREPVRALALFNRLQAPPSLLLSQKLAMLLAKRGDKQQTERAVEILRSVYMRPKLQPDDYTKLASIYVVDACLRHRLLDHALEIHEEAFNVGVTLDLPAYDALVRTLVESDRVDDATELLGEISADNDMSPSERSYFPVLEALVDNQDYMSATSLLRAARARGVQFTSETFHPLVELAETDEEATDSIVTFLSYVEQVWDEVKMLDDFADAIEDSDDEMGELDIPLALGVDDDDDDNEFQ